ncbi:MAG: AAA family ATPase [Caldilinea sp.]
MGAPQLLWQGQPWTLHRRQVRALLYRLAAEPAPAARSHLAFLFWPDAADAHARRQLTRLISTLRAALPDPRMVLVEEETVALDLDRIYVDSHAFGVGCTAEDTETLARTLLLHHGAFLAGFDLPDAPEYEAWQTETARHFHARYLGLLETLLRRYTKEGNLSAAIRCAQDYLAADELAEPIHRRLIELYVAAGDRGAALRQLDACTLILERELGVSPLPETRAALHLRSAPVVRPVVLVLPSLDLPLFGRDATLAQIQTAYDRLAGGHRSPGGMILITGEPGMGKSRVLHEFVARQSVLALVGVCHADGRSLPYYPLIQALRSTLTDAGLWNAVPTHWRSELLPLLPDLRAAFPNLAAPSSTASPLAQQHLYTAITQTFSAFAGQNSLLLCLDDLHLADEATFGWLRSIAVQWSDKPVIIAATAATIPPEIAALRQLLARAGRLAEVSLNGLTQDSTQRLLAHLPQTPSPVLARRIHQITGGNPFFVLEIIRELQESGQLAHPPAELPLPASVREAILARMSHLSPIARQILEAAAILDPFLDDTLLQQAGARTPAETVDALDELAAHQLLRASDLESRSAALAFPHALLRMAVLHSLTPWRRKLLHRRAGEAFLHYRPQNAAILAHHFTAAEAWETAMGYLQQAASQARAMYAYDVALAHLDRAFALLPNAPQPEAIHLNLLRQRLALRRTLVQIAAWQADAAELLRLAAASHDDAALLDALEAQISLHVLQSDFTRVEETAAQALSLARQTDDRLAEARIHQTVGWHLADALGRSREGLAHLQIACALAQTVGDAAVLYHSLCNMAFAQRAEGQCAAARAAAEQALALTPYRPDSPPHPAFADALRELGEANAYLGRWEEARSQLRPLLALYRTLDDPWAYGTVLYNYGLYSSNMGQHADAIDAMRRLVALSEAVGLPADSDYGVWHRAGLVRVLVAAGKPEEAGALLRSLCADKLTLGRPYLAWAKAVTEYRLATGEAADALEVLLPAVNWWRTNASPHDADVLLLLARVALATGDQVLAESAIAEATAHLAPTDMHRYHLRLHAVRYQVSGDPASLTAARAELASQAGFFNNAELRTAFLNNVSLHSQISAPLAL